MPVLVVGALLVCEHGEEQADGFCIYAGNTSMHRAVESMLHAIGYHHVPDVAVIPPVGYEMEGELLHLHIH